MILNNQIRFKIRAFSLVELTVTLILSFFVVSILYLSYQIMENQFRNEYQKQLSHLVLLKSGIEMDFFYADTIILEQDQLIVFKKGKIARYQFFNDAILKEANQRKDTLYKGECTASFNQQENSNWVSRLTLNFTTEKETIGMSFNKTYLPTQNLKKKEIRFEY